MMVMEVGVLQWLKAINVHIKHLSRMTFVFGTSRKSEALRGRANPYYEVKASISQREGLKIQTKRSEDTLCICDLQNSIHSFSNTSSAVRTGEQLAHFAIWLKALFDSMARPRSTEKNVACAHCGKLRITKAGIEPPEFKALEASGS